MNESSQTPNSAKPASASEERVLWKGCSSHWRYFGVYLLCLLFCWLVVPVFIAWWKYLENKNRVYEITTQRLRITQGIFSTTMEDLELYRVEDITVIRPFWMRLFGLGNVVLATNDTSSPKLVIDGMPQVMELHEHLRASVEACRDRKRVRVTELE